MLINLAYKQISWGQERYLNFGYRYLKIQSKGETP